MEGKNLKIEIYEANKITEELLEFAVIFTKHNDEWVYVQHKERDTWEIPGGHREKGEAILDTGIRELMEETGAKTFSIVPLFDYSVERDGLKRYGKVFYSVVEELGRLPYSEIGKVKLFDKIPENLTYTDIQLPLLKEAISYVEKIDKYEIIEHKKIVRDKIPEIIINDGRYCEILIQKNRDMKMEILKKLKEEIAEFEKEPSINEMADIYEVLEKMCKIYGYEENEIKSVKDEKKHVNGGFEKEYYLNLVRKQ